MYAPKYTLDYDDRWLIPYVYLDMDPTDPLQPVQFKYIQDFSFGYADWPFEDDGQYLPCGWVGIGEQSSEENPLYIIGNSPNPLHNETTIELELYKTSSVKLVVTSISGQQMFEKNYGQLNQGHHDLKLNFIKLSPGIYFYTIITDEAKVTRKMVVE